MSSSAVVTERGARLARPVFLRAVAASPLSPLASGVVLFVLLVVLQLLAWLAMGRLLVHATPITSVELRPMLFFAVVLSFGPTGIAWAAARARGDLEQLGPALKPSHRARLLADELERGRFATTAGIVLAMMIIAIIGMEANVGRISKALGPDRAAFDLYVIGMSLLSMVILAGPLLYMLRMSLGFRRVGLESIEVDLLDLSPLAPFGRFGVRTASIPLLVLGLGFIVGTNVRPGGVIVSILAVGGLSLAALLLPSLGVRQRIIDARTAEVERINRALRGDRTALRGSRIAEDADGIDRTGLLTYRSHLEALREWPIADGVWWRFAVYLLVPIATLLTKSLLTTFLGRVF